MGEWAGGQVGERGRGGKRKEKKFIVTLGMSGRGGRGGGSYGWKESLAFFWQLHVVNGGSVGH